MSAADIVLYDDATARTAEPFALSRPFGEMRAGALLVRERWNRVLGRTVSGRCGAKHLRTFDEAGAPPTASGRLPAGTIVVNSRFAPALGRPIAALAVGDALRAAGRIVAVALRNALDADALAEGTVDLESVAARTAGDAPGWWMERSWDLVRHLPEMLAADALVLATEQPDGPPLGADVLGEHRFAVARGAYVEPNVVADTTAGAVVVLEGARIGAFTRLAGPCVIGPHTQVNGGRLSGCSIGEHSRVGGEMSVVIVIGHANKAHDGFVGHSVIGRWANLGAGTITSNLKNSYGAVRVRGTSGDQDTGMQFLGSLIGDHAKIAIGTRLMTGTIVGAGANVFGDRSPDRLVPPFAWGDRAPFATYELGKFLTVAAHVMGRRGMALTAGVRDALAGSWEASHGAADAAPRREEPRSGPHSRRPRGAR